MHIWYHITSKYFENSSFRRSKSNPTILKHADHKFSIARAQSIIPFALASAGGGRTFIRICGLELPYRGSSVLMTTSRIVRSLSNACNICAHVFPRFCHMIAMVSFIPMQLNQLTLVLQAALKYLPAFPIWSECYVHYFVFPCDSLSLARRSVLLFKQCTTHGLIWIGSCLRSVGFLIS